jgi:hypothetical protein
MTILYELYRYLHDLDSVSYTGACMTHTGNYRYTGKVPTLERALLL